MELGTILIYHSRQRMSMRTARWDLPPRLVYVPSGNILREVDLAPRTVTTAFEATGADRVAGYSERFESWSGGHHTKEPPVLVRTRQADLRTRSQVTKSSGDSWFPPKSTARAA